MNTTLKIQRLWEYLGIQDDEILIVRSYNKETKREEYLIVKKSLDGLKITTEVDLPELKADQPFQLIQQLDSEGHYVIPSVDQMIQDKLCDY